MGFFYMHLSFFNQYVITHGFSTLLPCDPLKWGLVHLWALITGCVCVPVVANLKKLMYLNTFYRPEDQRLEENLIYE